MSFDLRDSHEGESQSFGSHPLTSTRALWQGRTFSPFLTNVKFHTEVCDGNGWCRSSDSRKIQRQPPPEEPVPIMGLTGLGLVTAGEVNRVG
jgi:hypothetical protein